LTTKELAHITEVGVEFVHRTVGINMMLRPEDSIHHQMNIGADIIMMLDNVVSSVKRRLNDDSNRAEGTRMEGCLRKIMSFSTDWPYSR
jgi:tRNA-guanine family transglycosylase